MNSLLEALVIALIAGGAFFALVGSIGLLKLSDFLRRLHGPTKASTLGVGGVLLAAMLHRYVTLGDIGIRELLITIFVFMTAPISAHLLAKAAIAQSAALNPPLPPNAEADGSADQQHGR